MTGADISTERVLAAIGAGATFAEIKDWLGVSDRDFRAVDGALQREKRAGRIRFNQRRWVKRKASNG